MLFRPEKSAQDEPNVVLRLTPHKNDSQWHNHRRDLLRIYRHFHAQKRVQDEPNRVLRLTPHTATINSRVLPLCTSDSTFIGGELLL